MMKPYRTIEDVLRSPWATMEPSRERPVTDRVLRSTKLEDSIHADLRDGDDSLEQTEQGTAKKLPSFPALSRGVFQSFYSLMPRKNDNDLLSTAARKFDGPILEYITQSEDYPTLKAVCEGLEQSVVDAANQAESKHRQVEAVGKLVDAGTAKNEDDVAAMVAMAVNAAAEKAEEVRSIIGAWSDEPGNMVKNEANAELLTLVRKSSVLRDISKYLDRFREIFAQGKRNGYAYGRGEKYSQELGRDLSRALTSELAMLASPQTTPLFLRKYQRGQIKQYQRLEPIYKGMGDIICCLDESDSTEGDPAAWGKAVALTLLDIAADSGRRLEGCS